MSEFKREVRYTVIKHNQLTESQMQYLKNCIFGEGIPTVEAVVVESDWPEFEPVWKMIEDRVSGAPVEGGKAEYDALAQAMTTNQTIGGVPREFVRGRYIVVKPDYEDDIRTERLRNYIEEMCLHTPDCIVVEADFPEYEPVWRMIEARVIGNPTELDAAKATISQLQGLVAELRALLDAPVGFSTPDCPDCACVQDGNCLCTPSKPAAQPQGEPVAWMDPRSPEMHATISNEVKQHNLKFGGAPSAAVNGYSIPLYAEQSAPVAVVLPERLDLPHRDEFESADQYAAAIGETKKWNACLDEVTRLNAKSR